MENFCKILENAGKVLDWVIATLLIMVTVLKLCGVIDIEWTKIVVCTLIAILVKGK